MKLLFIKFTISILPNLYVNMFVPIYLLSKRNSGNMKTKTLKKPNIYCLICVKINRIVTTISCYSKILNEYNQYKRCVSFKQMNDPWGSPRFLKNLIT